jgi:hypothetical protein
MDTSHQLGNVVTALRAKVKTSSLWTKWIWYILAGLASVVVVAWFAIDAYNRSQALAKALHDRDVIVQRQKMFEVNLQVQESGARQKELETLAQQHKQAAEVAHEKVVVLEQRTETNKQLINKLRGWDDIHAKVKF